MPRERKRRRNDGIWPCKSTEERRPQPHRPTATEARQVTDERGVAIVRSMRPEVVVCMKARLGCLTLRCGARGVHSPIVAAARGWSPVVTATTQPPCLPPINRSTWPPVPLSLKRALHQVRRCYDPTQMIDCSVLIDLPLCLLCPALACRRLRCQRAHRLHHSVRSNKLAGASGRTAAQCLSAPSVTSPMAYTSEVVTQMRCGMERARGDDSWLLCVEGEFRSQE